MVALARELGAAFLISVARLGPAESDVRGTSSTRSKTTGAVRQVRGDAEVGFWVVCWVARGGARQLAAAGSGSGAAERGLEALHRVSPWAGGVRRLFGLAHSPGAATDLLAWWCLSWCAGWASEGSCEPTMRTCRVSRTCAQWRLSPPPWPPCLPRLRRACLRRLTCLFVFCCCCISVLNCFSRCARVGPGGCGAVVPQARGTETAIAAAQ